MSALTVINGIHKEELQKQAESYAFRAGMHTRSLECFLRENGRVDGSVTVILIDGETIRMLKKDMFLVLILRFPVIFVPDCAMEWNMAGRELENAGCRTLYPFQYPNFCELVQSCFQPKIWQERTLVFGGLEICPANRMLRVKGQEMKMRQVDFDILLMLLENIGRVMSRQYLNDRLPQRLRGTQRNIDTHISSIRQQSGLGDAIRCVRSVGYCIPEEALYHLSLSDVG